MARMTDYVLRIYYYYSLAIGLLRHEFDFWAGRVQPTRRLTYYSLLLNLLTLSQIPYQFQLDVASSSRLSKAHDLYQFIYTLMTTARTGICVLILLLYWWRRHDIFCLIVDFQRLRRKHLYRLPISPLPMRRFRNALLRKLLLFSACDLFRFSMAFFLPDWRQCAAVVGTATHEIIANQVFNHLFIASCAANLYLDALNDEIRQIVNAAAQLEVYACQQAYIYRRRSAVLLNKFEALLALREELQHLIERGNKTLGTQTACVMLKYYLYNVCLVYSIYSITKPQEIFRLNTPPLAVVSSLMTSLLYFVDMVEFLVARQRLKSNLELCTPIIQPLLELRQLNEHWEQSIEQIHLHEAWNRYHSKIVGLFSLDNQMIFSCVSSTISRSILLVQYDYENF